jgi:hypothetical protein
VGVVVGVVERVVEVVIIALRAVKTDFAALESGAKVDGGGRSLMKAAQEYAKTVAAAPGGSRAWRAWVLAREARAVRGCSRGDARGSMGNARRMRAGREVMAEDGGGVEGESGDVARVRAR